jgi:hypothetical protein
MLETCGSADQRRGGEGDRAAGQRQAHRPGHGRAEAVQLGDPAAWPRKTPQISEVLPLLYLHGLSSGDFMPRRSLNAY